MTIVHAAVAADVLSFRSSDKTPAIAIEESKDPVSGIALHRFTDVMIGTPEKRRTIDDLAIHSVASFKAHMAMQAYAHYLDGKGADTDYQAALLKKAAVNFSLPDEKGEIEATITPYNEVRGTYENAIKVKIAKDQQDQIEMFLKPHTTRVAEPADTVQLEIRNFDKFKVNNHLYKQLTEHDPAAPVDLSEANKKAIVEYKDLFGGSWWQEPDRIEGDITPVNLWKRLCEKAKACMTDHGGTENNEEAFKELINKQIQKSMAEAAAAAP